MKFRLSFTFKIILPYLVIASLFLVVFLMVLDGDHPLVKGLLATGVVVSILLGIIHVRWLRQPFQRIRNLAYQLARGVMPTFSATKAPDEIGGLERDMEKHVQYLRTIINIFTSSIPLKYK